MRAAASFLGARPCLSLSPGNEAEPPRCRPVLPRRPLSEHRRPPRARPGRPPPPRRSPAAHASLWPGAGKEEPPAPAPSSAGSGRSEAGERGATERLRAAPGEGKQAPGRRCLVPRFVPASVTSVEAAGEGREEEEGGKGGGGGEGEGGGGAEAEAEPGGGRRKAGRGSHGGAARPGLRRAGRGKGAPRRPRGVPGAVPRLLTGTPKGVPRAVGPLRGFFTAPRGCVVPSPRWVSPHTPSVGVPSQPLWVSLKATSRWAGPPLRPPVCPLRGCRAPQQAAGDGPAAISSPPPHSHPSPSPAPRGETEARSWGGTQRNYEGGETLVGEIWAVWAGGVIPTAGGGTGCALRAVPAQTRLRFHKLYPKEGFRLCEEGALRLSPSATAGEPQSCPHQLCLGFGIPS